MRLKDTLDLSKLCRTAFWGCTAAFALVALTATPAQAGLSGPILGDCPGFEDCSSNDLQATIIAATPAGSDLECNPKEGDNTIALEITTELVARSGAGIDPEAQVRYDVGLYVEIERPAVSCQRDIIEDGNFSGGAINSDDDNCREVSTSVVTHTNVFTDIPCVDEDNDGSVDPFVICQSWGNNADQIEDCTVQNVDTGTNPKCFCQTFDPQITFPICGNGIVGDTKGEQCDDGNQVNDDGCDNECQLPVCGDGDVEGDEECDEGVSGNGGCCVECVLVGCGDGEVNCGEACDDGNESNNDGCTNSCVANVCGDGFLHEGVEQCDDGNKVDNDFCGIDCQLPVCGNGEVEGDEGCDDGELNGTEKSECGSDCDVEVPTMGEAALGGLALLLLGAGLIVARKNNLV